MTGCWAGYFCYKISIIPFEEKYTCHFKQLNIEWLQQYFVIEAYDEYQLSHPIQEIIDKGGCIFLAKENENIIGTVALMKETDRSFEITKMSLTKDSRGKGVSKLLMDACIQLANDKIWDRLFLFPIPYSFQPFNYIVVMASGKFL